MQPILGRTWLEWIRLSRIFRAPFANLSLEIVKKMSRYYSSYLVFRGSSANLSPTCTFLERYLSRRHFKSMPVDLDYIKPFMGFCTTLICKYIYIYIINVESIPYSCSNKLFRFHEAFLFPSFGAKRHKIGDHTLVAPPLKTLHM